MDSLRRTRRFEFLVVVLCGLFLWSGSVGALEVAPNSPCSNFCIDGSGKISNITTKSTTLSSDLSCLDSDYMGANSTVVGRKFQSCVSCEARSRATWDGTAGTSVRRDDDDDDDDEVEVDEDSVVESDLYWFLFHMKSTVSWCVNGFFDTEQNPNATLGSMTCGSACAPIASALDDQLKETNMSLLYQYCESDDRKFLTGADKCRACLGRNEGLRILGNFVDLLFSACKERPDPGETLTQTSVFAITTATTLSATNHITDPKLPSGAIVGIVVGTIIFFIILGFALFLVLRRRYGIRGRGGLDGVVGKARSQARGQSRGQAKGEVREYAELEETSVSFSRGVSAVEKKPAQQSEPVELPAWGPDDEPQRPKKDYN